MPIPAHFTQHKMPISAYFIYQQMPISAYFSFQETDENQQLLTNLSYSSDIHDTYKTRPPLVLTRYTYKPSGGDMLLRLYLLLLYDDVITI